MVTLNQSTYDILEKSPLSQPRMMGTKGEEETVEFLLKFLKDRKMDPFKEEIEWFTTGRIGMKLLFTLAALVVCLFNVFLRIKQPYNGIISIVFVLVSIISLVLFFSGLMNDKFPFLGKKVKGNNVICELNPKLKSKKQNIIYFIAHYDSIASNLYQFVVIFILGTLLGLLLASALTITSSIISLVIFYKDQLETNLAIRVINILVLAFSALVVLIAIVNLFEKKSNDSPGACDNGSGCVILLSLAEYFQNSPLDNTQLKFIWSGAEEWGIYGAKGYVKAHEEEIVENKDNSYLFNFDMVGSELAYLGKTGLIIKKELNERLNEIIEETAKENEIEAKKFNSALASLTDHTPFKNKKVQVSSFTSMKDFKFVHSSKDSIDKVNPEKLKDAVSLISKVVEKLDKNSES